MCIEKVLGPYPTVSLMKIIWGWKEIITHNRRDMLNSQGCNNVYLIGKTKIMAEVQDIASDLLIRGKL